MATYNGRELTMEPVSTFRRGMEWVHLEPGDGTRYEFAWGLCPFDVFAGVGDGSKYVLIVTKYGFYTMPIDGLRTMEDSLDAHQVSYFLEHVWIARGEVPWHVRHTFYVILSYVKTRVTE